jgi:hypothetical protein
MLIARKNYIHLRPSKRALCVLHFCFHTRTEPVVLGYCVNRESLPIFYRARCRIPEACRLSAPLRTARPKIQYAIHCQSLAQRSAMEQQHKLAQLQKSASAQERNRHANPPVGSPPPPSRLHRAAVQSLPPKPKLRARRLDGLGWLCWSVGFDKFGATMGRTGRPNLIHYAIGDSA